ncbi:DUF3877 family protein [Lacrimispora sp. JR3]|uniref:DUF3877 family protein n=1 Tax=Lacrimispora sinapis TaxID=3111456 RepID=UPI003748E134
MQYAFLEQMLMNSIKEVQIKLGYEKEAIRFYYPEKALCKIVKISGDSKEETKEFMEGFKEYTKDKLGRLKITKSQGRFCFEIPAEGVDYVYNNVEDNGFLREFIETVEKPHATLDDILSVFGKYSNGRIICEKSSQEECDYIIFFEDASFDYYRYYLKFHENHVTYHRFLLEEAMEMGI